MASTVGGPVPLEHQHFDTGRQHSVERVPCSENNGYQENSIPIIIIIII